MDELRYGIDSRIGDSGTIQSLDYISCRKSTKHIQDRRVHYSAVLDSKLVRLKEWVLTEFWSLENVRTECRPFATIVNTEDYPFIFGFIWPIWRNRRMACAGPRRRRSSHGVIHRVTHPFTERVEKRYLKSGAFTGTSALNKCCKDSAAGLHTARDIR